MALAMRVRPLRTPVPVSFEPPVTLPLKTREPLLYLPSYTFFFEYLLAWCLRFTGHSLGAFMIFMVEDVAFWSVGVSQRSLLGCIAVGPMRGLSM